MESRRKGARREGREGGRKGGRERESSICLLTLQEIRN
jgi:hypothetical protein